MFLHSYFKDITAWVKTNGFRISSRHRWSVSEWRGAKADAESEEIGRTRLGRCIRSQKLTLTSSFYSLAMDRVTTEPLLGYLGIRHLSRFYRRGGSTTTAPRSIALQLPPSFVQLFYRLEWWRASSLDGRFRLWRKRTGEFFTQSVDKSMQERFLLASSGISIGHLGGMNELLIARVEHSIVRVFLFLI